MRKKVVEDVGGVALSTDLLDSLGEGISVSDRNGHIVFSNRAADRILGRGASAGAPDTWADHYGVFLPDRRTRFPTDEYPLLRALRGEVTDNVEMFIRNDSVPDGVLISVTGRPVRDAGGDIVGASVVFRDITAIRDVEENLRRANEGLRTAQAHQAELAAFIVHDLRNPLASVQAEIEHQLTRAGLAADVRESLLDASEAASTMHRMLLDLLDVHLAEDGMLVPDKRPLDVAALLADVRILVSAQLTRHGQRLLTSMAADVPAVSADRSLLRRVVQNLVDNCMKFSPAGTTVWLDVRPSAGGLAILVSDEGPGVPPALRERIFEKYARVERVSSRAADSRGLGLRFCRLAIAAHGGRVFVGDNHPRGACFTVELPADGPGDGRAGKRRD